MNNISDPLQSGLAPLILGLSSIAIAIAIKRFEEPPPLLSFSPECPYYVDRSLRKFAEAMERRQRFIDWSILMPKLELGEGSIILERGPPHLNFKIPIRIWWTSEDVQRTASIAPPKYSEIDFYGTQLPHPFNVWCSERYLDEISGIASLTFPAILLPLDVDADLGYCWREILKKWFPSLCVVNVPYKTIVCSCGKTYLALGRYPRCECGLWYRRSG